MLEACQQGECCGAPQKDIPSSRVRTQGYACTRAGSGQASTSGRAWDDGERQSGGSGGAMWRALPRADVLILGGDLAYPNPSTETYEQRFFAPFEAALPPPPVRCSFYQVAGSPSCHQGVLTPVPGHEPGSQ